MDKIGIYAFSIIVIACLFVSGCSSPLKQPSLSVTSITQTKATPSELGYDVTVSIDNPNPVGITLKTLTFDVYYKDNNEWVFISHTEKSGVEIKPGSNVVTIPFTVSSTELARSRETLKSSGEVTLQVRGTAAPDILGFGPEIPFTYTRTVMQKVPAFS
jgi:LEA14-like dessication related protein